MIPVAESPIRNAACVTAGCRPSSMNAGTNTGPSSDHSAEPDTMNRLSTVASRMSITRAANPVSPRLSSSAAARTASMIPTFDQLKTAITCAATNIITT